MPLIIKYTFTNFGVKRLKYMYIKTFGYYKIGNILQTFCNKNNIDSILYNITYEDKILNHDQSIAHLHEIGEYSILTLIAKY